MRLHRHRTIATATLTVAILIIVNSPAAAQDDWSVPGGHRHETPPSPPPEDPERLGPGSRVAWLLDDGELGHGFVRTIDDATLVVEPGRRLDRDRCVALWRAGRSRGGAMGRGMGAGVAMGLLASSAMYALYYDSSPSSFENLGPGIGSGMAIIAGAILGAIAGTVGPEAETWQLVDAAPGADTRRVDELPPPSGKAGPRWPRRAWLEVAGAAGSVGWHGDTTGRGGSGVRTALWLPLSGAVELGAAVTVTAPSRLPDGSGLAAAALLRAGTDVGSSQPYVVFGIGQYGMLGDTPGFCLAGGLRLPMGGDWAGTVEVTTVHGLRSVAGDNPGLASLSLGIGRSLGSGSP